MRWALWVTITLKAALIGLLLFAALFPDSPQFEGKAMGGCAIAYPIAVLIVPAAWWVISHRPRAQRIVAAVVTAWLLWPRRARQMERVSTTLSSPGPS